MLHQELQFFDHSKLSNELFEELGQIVQAPNFQTDLVCDVSQACESLCSWVRAVYQYACVKRCMAPQEAHKKHLNNCMAEIRARLQVARLQEEAAQERLEVIEKQQQFVRNNIKELSAQVHKVEIQEKEASVTIKQISDYIEKWNMAKKVNKHSRSYLFLSCNKTHSTMKVLARLIIFVFISDERSEFNFLFLCIYI